MQCHWWQKKQHICFFIPQRSCLEIQHGFNWTNGGPMQWSPQWASHGWAWPSTPPQSSGVHGLELGGPYAGSSLHWYWSPVSIWSSWTLLDWEQALGTLATISTMETLWWFGCCMQWNPWITCHDIQVTFGWCHHWRKAPSGVPMVLHWWYSHQWTCWPWLTQ